MKTEDLFNEINKCTPETWEHTKKVLRACAKHIVSIEKEMDQFQNSYSVQGEKLKELSEKEEYTGKLVKTYSAEWITKANPEVWESVSVDGKTYSFDTVEEANDYLEKCLEKAEDNYSSQFKEYATNIKKNDPEELKKCTILKTRILERTVSNWIEVPDSQREIEPLTMMQVIKKGFSKGNTEDIMNEIVKKEEE